MQKRAPHVAPPSRPPTCTPRDRCPPFWCLFTCSRTRDSERGLKKLPDSRQRSDFSLAMSQGFGHKSHRIHIYQLALAFVPWKRRTWSGPFSRPAPPGVPCQRQPNVFDCCPPGHGTCTAAQANTLTCACAHTYTQTHTHTPPCPQHSPAWRWTIPPDHIKRKAPQLLLRSYGFTPKGGSSKVAGLGLCGRQTLPPVAQRQIENIPNIKLSSIHRNRGLILLELGVKRRRN